MRPWIPGKKVGWSELFWEARGRAGGRRADNKQKGCLTPVYLCSRSPTFVACWPLSASQAALHERQVASGVLNVTSEHEMLLSASPARPRFLGSPGDLDLETFLRGVRLIFPDLTHGGSCSTALARATRPSHCACPGPAP